MRTPEERMDYDRRAGELSRFLSGRNPKTIAEHTPADLECFRRASVMLCADELLESAQYALTLLDKLSTDDFAAGGDAPARKKLGDAIRSATEYVHDDRRAVEKTVITDIRNAVENNTANCA